MDNQVLKFEGKTASEYVQEKLKTTTPSGILISGHKKRTDNILNELASGQRNNIDEARQSINFDLKVAEIILPLLTDDERREFIDVYSSISEELSERYLPYIDTSVTQKVTVEVALKAIEESRGVYLDRSISSMRGKESQVSRK